jgi:GGDEF domain-containing protein
VAKLPLGSEELHERRTISAGRSRMHHIVNNLWLGSQQDADDLVRHNPEKITAILNVRGPDAYHPPGRDQSAQHPGKAYKWIPVPDTGVLSVEQVREAVLWLQEQAEKQQRILIHCKHGISRSPGVLGAFMVKSGISPDLAQAIVAIKIRRNVQPAAQMLESSAQVVLTSALTGLPNRQAFDRGEASPFVAVVDVDLMRIFNESYGRIAGDLLLRRLAKILISVGLDAYYDRADEFLCKCESREELNAKLLRARQLFMESFQVYADGRIRTIEGSDFSFGIGATHDEQRARLQQERNAKAEDQSPEWLREIIATTSHGPGW